MSDLAARLLPWFERHGRHDLPWQGRGAYATWVSEIMLQQTQVATAAPYFRRFLARFPDVHALAAAPLDDVLACWSGLGYYARARNLHRAAVRLVQLHGGELPRDAAAWQALPGIGRSTAGAIMALAYGARHAILDGNVKRVLVRYHAIDRWPGEPSVERQLWDLAEAHTPRERVAEYTQAIMDLGATLCTRAQPHCEECPLRADCRAHTLDLAHVMPRPRPRRARPLREAQAVLVEDVQGRVLLERRPARGIWGGLYSLPELQAGMKAAEWAELAFGAPPPPAIPLARIEHAFTHFDLVLEVIGVTFEAGRLGTMDGTVAAAGDAIHDAMSGERIWREWGTLAEIGLPAPIRALLEGLQRDRRAVRDR